MIGSPKMFGLPI